MKIVLSIAAAATLIANAAVAAELPSFEARGFPISPVQVQLVGAAGVQQPSVAAAVDGISASPVQLSVLTPRTRRTTAAAELRLTQTGVVAR